MSATTLNVAHFLDRTVRLTPDRVAIVCGPLRLTYAQLDFMAQQIAGGLLWALAQAVIPAPEWVAGMPRARTLGQAGLPRIGDTPDLTIRLVPSTAPSGGVSGLGTTVLAPAVANAIFAGSGKRMRALPFDPMAT